MRTPDPEKRHLLLEVLEPRIAPAGLADIDFKAVTVGSSILLRAGEGLSTSDLGGSYLLYVEKGQALVFTTDLNANNSVDFNEITGIAAGAGLQLTSFVDINGDIVTNLTPSGRLTDSDSNAANGYDGKVVLNSVIESIKLRSITAAELPERPGETVNNRIVKSTYSIYGNIYAGGGIGTLQPPALVTPPATATVTPPASAPVALPNSGIVIDTSGFESQQSVFGVLTLAGEEGSFPVPSLGYIFTGSAVSGKVFSFGTSPDFGDGPTQSLRGKLAPFIPAAGQAGGDVLGIKAGLISTTEEVDAVTGKTISTELLLPSPFQIGGILTGNGGPGARGGDIVGISIQGDIGGLKLETGSGGDGAIGGNGGSIKSLSIKDSVNSRVVIRTGDGGDGLIGASGAAGQVLFDGEIEMMGQIQIGLGRGGDAIGNAGPGTSIATGDFLDVKPGNYLPAQFVSTWRMPGDLGDAQVFRDDQGNVRGYVERAIDFDKDGFSDAVFLTDVPDQLVVAFGSDDPSTPGTFDPQRAVYLDSPAYAQASIRTSAVVVLDANDDDLPDIATGQSAGNGYLGIMVYINKGFDSETGEWLGFDIPRHSPLPLTGGNRDTTMAIVNLASGDFDRDGITDIGVIVVGRTANTSPPFFGSLFVMSGLTEKTLDSQGQQIDERNGFFAVDFDKGKGNLIQKNPYVSFGRGNQETFTFVMYASAAEAGNEDTDLLGVLSRGGRDIGASVVSGLGSGEFLNIFSMQPSPGVVKEQLSQSEARLRYSERVLDGDPLSWVGYGQTFEVIGSDFTFIDADKNGIFDAVVVGQPTGDRAPGYLVAATLQGTYQDTGNASELDFGISQPRLVDPGAPVSPNTPGGNYYGIALTEFRSSTATVASVLDRDLENRQVLRLVAGNFFSGNNGFNPDDDQSPWEATIALNGIDLFGNNNPPSSQIAIFGITGFGQYPSVANGLPEFRLITRQAGFTPVQGNDDATRTSFFDYYRPQVEQYPSVGNLTAGLVNELAPVDVFWGVVVDDFHPKRSWFPLAASTLNLIAGGGGWSILGKGGAGGSVGVGELVLQSDNTLRGSINSFGHVLQGIQGGAGGFGLLGGGNGGGTSGVVATAQTNFVPPDVKIETGAGGASLLGAGGSGGSASQFQFRTSLAGTTLIEENNPPQISITTAEGGFGLTGGSGGNITGRNTIDFPDTDTDSTVIKNGHGAYGVNRGGSGGSATGLIGVFGTIGGVNLRTGEGGASAAGSGGAGGTLDLRPSPLRNSLDKDVILSGGNGGNGLTGGSGGSILNFLNQSSLGNKPSKLEAIAGHGGDGVTGSGGQGGSITGFNVTVSAIGGIGLVSAGDGGVGSASVGGAGGVLSVERLTAEAGAAVGFAGAGGDGMRGGGAGGVILSTTLNSGALTDARVVAMAGAGGDAHGVSLATVIRESTAPVSAFAAVYTLGTSDGRGGNGGSISGFVQPVATQASTDLVAGNGGGTINFGRISDMKPLVGKGGSISNVSLAGSAGTIDPNAAIRSFAPDFASLVRSGTISVINNETVGVGNVGVLVGAGGLIRNEQPASGALSGSVAGFAAKDIMSMVAGSVDRIAAITSVSGIQLVNGGTNIGVLKNSYINPNTLEEVAVSPDLRKEYPTIFFGSPVSPSTPVPPGFQPYQILPNASGGGDLIDGAVVTKKYSGPFSNFVFPG